MKAKNDTGIKTIQLALKTKPVITSIVCDDDLEQTLNTTSNIVFLLTGNIFTLQSIAEQIKDAGKLLFVHFDLVEGLGRDSEGVRYLAEEVRIDGIVTTRANIILAAKKCGLMTIQRLFFIDSASLENGIRIIKSSQPDAIEVLPGIVIPRVINKIRQEVDLPAIAGGLMYDLDDLRFALDSGAIGISTSSKELWAWQDAKGK